MANINLLDERTINKIAAGEVVQNGASVVKELVENSIDAGATGIIIDVEKGGKSKIRITDNGAGMSREDVERAYLRHATSKIASAEEIASIDTLGFRGEALSSIAAVSMMEIRSRTAQDDVGSVLKISGGKVESIKPAGLPQGTTVSVSSLFYNTPARLKFLKGTAVETGYITEIAAKYILAYPEISFHYISNGETVFKSAGMGRMDEALMAVYGAQILNKVRFISRFEENISISGYIGMPQFSMKNRRHQSFFVNRRYVKNAFISSALSKAYSERILKGHYPFAVLFISLPADRLDVNVHPQKLEIKFDNEQEIEQIILGAVDEVLGTSPIVGSVAKLSAPEVPPLEPARRVVISNPDADAIYSGFDVVDDQQTIDDLLDEPYEKLHERRFGPGSFTPPETPDADGALYEGEEEYTTLPGVFIPYEDGPLTDEDAAPPTPGEDVTLDLDATPDKTVVTSTMKDVRPVLADGDYRLIGTAFDCYLLLEYGDKLIIMDQHAAHERILYDQLIAKIQAREATSQLLLAEEVYHCTAQEYELYENNMRIFAEMGFDVAPHGQNSLVITAVPSDAVGISIPAMMDEFLFELSRTREKPVIRRDKLIAAMCRRAVKANDKLSDRDVEVILRQFVEIGEYPTCPHGRPIMTVVTKTELEKSFKRRL